jgi:biopolymer transport protein ExbB
MYALAKEDPSELAQLVAAGLAALSAGIDEARDAIERLGEMITVEMEKKISMLAVIGTLGPMIGLLGTLLGMIESFGVIAASGSQIKANEVAGGISRALVLTFEGVALSVPAIYFFAFFKNRVSTLSLEAINEADDCVRKVYLASRARPTRPEATAGAAPAKPL